VTADGAAPALTVVKHRAIRVLVRDYVRVRRHLLREIFGVVMRMLMIGPLVTVRRRVVLVVVTVFRHLVAMLLQVMFVLHRLVLVGHARVLVRRQRVTVLCHRVLVGQ
jgi:hypothetical protein